MNSPVTTVRPHNSTSVRWGVLSTSRTAVEKVIPAIQASSNGTVVALASRDAARAKAAAEKLGIPRNHGSYQGLLDDGDVDAVYVPLPNNQHAAWTIKAAEAGKHVLVEKPAAVSPAECRAALAACEKNGVWFMEGFAYRFHPQHHFASAVLRRGDIGELRLIRVSFSFPLEPRHSRNRLEPSLAGGCLWDVGVYTTSLASHLAGMPPRQIFASASRQPDEKVETTCAALLDFPNGAQVMIDCSFHQPRRQACEIVGFEGVMLLSNAFSPSGETQVVVRGRQGESTERFPPFDQFRAEVEHFADCVLHRKAPRITPGETLLNTAIACALHESIRSNRVIAFTPPANQEPS